MSTEQSAPIASLDAAEQLDQQLYESLPLLDKDDPDEGVGMWP